MMFQYKMHQNDEKFRDKMNEIFGRKEAKKEEVIPEIMKLTGGTE